MVAAYIELGHKGVFLSGSSSDGTNSVSAPFVQDVNVVSEVAGTPAPGASSLTKAEDAAHVTGDVGVAILAKRTDTAAVSGQTDGDYSTVNVDASGRLWVNPGIIQNEDAIHGSGDAGVMALGVRRDTPTALGADGDYIPPTMDSAGRLHTRVGVIDSGENHLGEVGGHQAHIQGTVGGATTIAAAGDYAANDIISNDAAAGVAWLFTGLARVSGGTGTVYRANITGSVDALVPRLRLWLFNSDPSNSTRNDNAAFSIDAADRTKIIGYIDFPAMADAGGISYTQNITDRLGFAASGSANVYGILQTLDAFTNESAGMTVTIGLFAAQD